MRIHTQTYTDIRTHTYILYIYIYIHMHTCIHAIHAKSLSLFLVTYNVAYVQSQVPQPAPGFAQVSPHLGYWLAASTYLVPWCAAIATETTRPGLLTWCSVEGRRNPGRRATGRLWNWKSLGNFWGILRRWLERYKKKDLNSGFGVKMGWPWKESCSVIFYPTYLIYFMLIGYRYRISWVIYVSNVSRFGVGSWTSKPAMAQVLFSYFHIFLKTLGSSWWRCLSLSLSPKSSRHLMDFRMERMELVRKRYVRWPFPEVQPHSEVIKTSKIPQKVSLSLGEKMAQIGGTDRLHPSTFVAKWGLEVMDTPWLHHDISLEPLVQWSPGISSAMLGTLAELHIISWAVWAFQDWHRNEEKNTCLVSSYWFSHHLLSLSALGRGLDGEFGTDDVHFHPLWSLLQLLGQFDQPGSMGDGRGGQWAGDVHKHARCGIRKAPEELGYPHPLEVSRRHGTFPGTLGNRKGIPRWFMYLWNVAIYHGTRLDYERVLFGLRI